MLGVRCSLQTSKPATPTPAAGLRWWSAGRALGAFVLLSVPLGTQALAGGQTAPPVFSWKSRYADALEAARKQQLLVAVYFRPVLGSEPRPLRLASKTKNLGRLVSGVRVGAAEVLELKERFQVERFPALVVLDERERVLMHWQEPIPPDVWARVARRFRQLEERRARQEKDLAEARTLFDTGQPGLAYKRLRPILRSGRTARRVFSAAKDLEAHMIEAGEERLLLVVAADGLIPDAQLVERLRALVYEPMPPRLKETLDHELRRLETTTIGGRAER